MADNPLKISSKDNGPFSAMATIGSVIDELLGRSVWRMIVVFICVFFGSLAPAALVIFISTAASHSTTRGILIVAAAICIFPFGAIVGFNYVAYRGLSKIVEELGLGKLIGSELVAYLVPGERMRIPLPEFTERFNDYFNGALQKIKCDNHGLKGLLISATSSVVLLAIKLAMRRIAKGCSVDGELDLALFAQKIADRADSIVIGYFKKMLWDLTRILLVIGQLLLWCSLWLIIQIIGFIS